MEFAKEIRAWADGKIIQRWNSLLEKWEDDAHPIWHPTEYYRIKPVCLISEDDLRSIRRVFPDAKYVTMDSDGLAVLWEKEPRLFYNMWGTDETEEDTSVQIPGFDNYTDDYSQSFIDIDEALDQ